MDTYHFKNISKKDVKRIYRFGMSNIQKNNPESKLIHKIKTMEDTRGSSSFGSTDIVTVFESRKNFLGIIPVYKKKFDVHYMQMWNGNEAIVRIYDENKKPAVNRLVRMKYAHALG